MAFVDIDHYGGRINSYIAVVVLVIAFPAMVITVTIPAMVMGIPVGVIAIVKIPIMGSP